VKISYRTPAGSGGWQTLAEDGASPLLDSISGFKPDLSKNPQVDPLAFSVAPFVRDVGNGTWTVSFNVDRQHSTADDALAFLQSHADAMNQLANVDLAFLVGAKTTYMPACALTRFSPDPHSDQSTRCQYSFTGGTYTSTSP
jgi:hypothetical protein